MFRSQRANAADASCGDSNCHNAETSASRQGSPGHSLGLYGVAGTGIGGTHNGTRVECNNSGTKTTKKQPATPYKPRVEEFTTNALGEPQAAGGHKVAIRTHHRALRPALALRLTCGGRTSGRCPGRTGLGHIAGLRLMVGRNDSQGRKQRADASSVVNVNVTKQRRFRCEFFTTGQ